MEAISIESDPHLYFQVGKIKISEGMKCLLDLVKWYKDNLTPENAGRVNEIMAYLKSLQQQVVQEIESLAQQGECLVSSNVNGAVCNVGRSWELKKMISLLGRYGDEDEVVYEIVRSWIVDWNIDKKLCSMLTRVSRNDISTKALKLCYYASMSSNVNKFQYTVKALSMGKIVTSNSVTSYSRFDVDMLEWVMGCKEAFCELEHMDPDFKSINFMKDDWDEATLLYNSWKVLEDLRKEAQGTNNSKSSSHSGHGASNSSITLSQKLHIIRTSSAFSQHVNDTATPESELDCYLRDSKCPSSEGFDILEWWLVNSPTYPILAKIARDFLSIPIYTPLSGLDFSLLHEIMDIYRCSNLDDDLKWPLACTKVWLNSSVIK
ncbi:hypothetical protein Pint_25908 [Pistacia integerrima]|uniref:Uncharacterized protein n=1 Tax=Pistacia integerrima TaxID=434235 RepID=A0ACC0YAP1_9ROSI|nr:hypothetical protein Pint_25908 [Pistacia integerrima]